MTPDQARKHRGYATEKIVADYFAKNGFPYALATGASRQGTDVTGVLGVDIEVKARRGLVISAAMKQLRERASDALPVAVLRMDGSGEASISEFPTVLRLEDFVLLLKKAGY